VGAEEDAVGLQEANPEHRAPQRPWLTGAVLQADGRVLVTWDKVPGATAYTILCQADGKEREACSGRLPGSPTKHYIARHRLTHGAVYQFQVAALVGDIKGPPSAPSEPLTVQHTVHQLAPGAVKHIKTRKGKKGIILSWDRAPLATSYTVLFKKDKTSVWNPYPGGASITRTKLLLSHLPYMTPIEVAVVAGNEHGLGIVSKAPSPVTAGGRAPRGAAKLTVERNDAVGAHLMWVPPRKGGQLPVDRFKIYVSEKGYAGSEQVYDVENEDGVVIDELKDSTRYQFSVRSGNAAGYGPFSNVVEMETGSSSEHRTDLFIILWVCVEVVLVLLIVAVIAFIWRKRQNEVSVDYMQMDTYGDDDMVDLEYAGEKGSFFQVRATPEPPMSKAKRITIHSVLNDINERIDFRDKCEERGYLDYFHFFQVVEDFHRCAPTEQPMRAREVIRWYLEEKSERRVSVCTETYQDINVAECSNLSSTLFDAAQAEVVSALETLVLPMYLEERHKMVATPPEIFAPMPTANNSQKVTASAFNRMCLAHLQHTDGTLRKRCEEELGAEAPFLFVAAVERFRTLAVSEMPAVAHDIVEAHMASDAKSRVSFTSTVQQELINTARPHSAMFDNAQKEALYILWQILCPTAPMPKPVPGWPRKETY